MKKTIYVTIALYITTTSSLYGLELIDESAIESLRSMPYEEYDSGYGLWNTADMELFVSKDENFSIGIWKSKAGSEEINTPYPYNVFFLIKSCVTTNSNYCINTRSHLTHIHSIRRISKNNWFLWI